MPTIAIGVIGTGGMGARHVANLQRHVSGVRVAAVYDLDQVRAQEVARINGVERVIADPFQLIADTMVDAVVIAAPDPTHAEFARACLAQGKPVLCEKPLATNAADALHVVEAECAGGKRLIGVGFMRRFDPPHVAVQQIVQSGTIGRPFLFKGASRNPMIPGTLSTSTMFTNSVIHDLDSVQWFMGQPIRDVFARGVRTRDAFSSATLDLLLVQLTLADGSLATIEASLAVEYGYEIFAEVIGERGVAEALQPDQARVRVQQQTSLAVPQDWLARFQTAYVTEFQAWVDSLHHGETFSGASAWDGYLASLAAEACIESLRTGLPVVVPTPPMPALYHAR